MKLLNSLTIALAFLGAILGSGTSATAHDVHGTQNTPPLIQRLLVQQMLLLGRGYLDLRYEHLAIEPGTNALVLSGLTLYPLVEPEQDPECEIAIDQMVVEGNLGLDAITIGWEATGARFPSSCFGSEGRDILTEAGYENILFDSASMEFAYSLPDSSARIAVRLAVRDAAVLGLGAEFDRLWLTETMSEMFENPSLLGTVSQAEFTVEDLGLARRIMPIILEQAGLDDTDVPGMLRTAFLEMLEIDESQPLSEEEQAFAEELSAGITAFWQDRRPLVVTVHPVDDVYSDDIFLLSDGDRLGFLRPKVSNLPSSLRSIVPPADVAAALADAASLDDATRIKIGTALLTGDGAPRSIEAGARILLPVAKDRSGEAAVILAKAYQSVGRNGEAYRMALVALASGDRGAAAIADELERSMPLAEIMAVQDEAGVDWPGRTGFETAIDAAVADGDVRAIAAHAHAASAGRDLPRSFGDAYMLATLAAASGDRSAARLRDRLDRRFGGDAHWRSVSGEASDEALARWIDGGMGAAVLAAAEFTGWCQKGGTFAEFSFTLENGKTVSICENAGSSDVTYFYGVLGKPPELKYRGPLRGTIEGLSGFSHDLAGLGDYGFNGPQVDADVSQEVVAAAAAAQDSKGFFLVRSMGSSGGEETAIMFRSGGWEYAVSIGYSRNVNPEIAGEPGDYFGWSVISLISPDGRILTIR